MEDTEGAEEGRSRGEVWVRTLVSQWLSCCRLLVPFVPPSRVARLDQVSHAVLLFAALLMDVCVATALVLERPVRDGRSSIALLTHRMR